MSIALIEQQFVFALAPLVIIGPIRWPNENWPVGFSLSPDNQLLDSTGNPVSFVEAEVIAGLAWSAIAPSASRQSTRIGLLRVYLIAPQGSGRSAINDQADIIDAAFKRATVYINPPLRLYTMDPRIDDGVAEHTAQTNVRIDAAVPGPWHGSRWVRQISIPWFFDYLA